MRRRLHLLIRDPRAIISNVLANRAREKIWLLWNNADLPSQRIQINISDIMPVNRDPTRGNVIQTHYQRHDRRLSCTRRPHQRNRSPRLHVYVHVTKNRFAGFIVKPDTLEPDLTLDLMEGCRALHFDDIRLYV